MLKDKVPWHGLAAGSGEAASLANGPGQTVPLGGGFAIGPDLRRTGSAGFAW